MHYTRLILVMLLVMFAVSCRTVSPKATSDLSAEKTKERAKIAESVADLLDLYVFPAPGKPGRVAVAVSLRPLSKDEPFFSEQVNYVFYLREMKIIDSSQGSKLQTWGRGERAIMCWFKVPDDLSKHSGTCSVPKVGEVSSTYGEPSSGGDVDFFHGLRRDPFAFDSKQLVKLRQQGSQPKTFDKQSNAQNVLSIVLEFSPAQIFGRDVDLLAVSAQSYTTSSDGRPKTLDRVGRPGLGEIFFYQTSKSDDLKERFFRENPLEVSEKNRALYRDRLVERINDFDKADGQVNWDESALNALADLLVDDSIIVNVSKDKNGEEFLDIERAVLDRKKSETFGGRGLQSDTWGVLLKWSQSHGGYQVPPTKKSGVGKSLKQFPYLDTHDPSWGGVDLRERARQILGR